MSARIVQSRMQTKIDIQGSRVLRRVQRRTSKSVREVVAVERGLGGLVDRDTVRLNLQSINGLRNVREGDWASSNHGRESLVVEVIGVKADRLVRNELGLRLRGAIELLVGEQSKAMPVAVLVGVGSADVLRGAETDVHGLNGPLKLREQLVLRRGVHARALKAVHADERESNTFYVDVVTLFTGFDVI